MRPVTAAATSASTQAKLTIARVMRVNPLNKGSTGRAAAFRSASSPDTSRIHHLENRDDRNQRNAAHRVGSLGGSWPVLRERGARQPARQMIVIAAEKL